MHANGVVVIPLPEVFTVKAADALTMEDVARLKDEEIEKTYTFTLQAADTTDPYYDVTQNDVPRVLWELYPPHKTNPIKGGDSIDCAQESWFARSTPNGWYSSCGDNRDRMARNIVRWIVASGDVEETS